MEIAIIILIIFCVLYLYFYYGKRKTKRYPPSKQTHTQLSSRTRVIKEIEDTISTRSKRLNKCITCAKRNTIACPYGNNQYCVACSDYVLNGFGNYYPTSRTFQRQVIRCPNCESEENQVIYGGDHPRHQCNSCGKVFT